MLAACTLVEDRIEFVDVVPHLMTKTTILRVQSTNDEDFDVQERRSLGCNFAKGNENSPMLIRFCVNMVHIYQYQAGCWILDFKFSRYS